MHSIGQTKIAFFCILATDIGQTDRQTNRQTNEKMDSIDALSRSRCRERRLNNSYEYVPVLCVDCVLADPYVKIWLLHDGKKVEKKKTPIKEKTLNPVFEEIVTFTVPYERIRQTSLIVSVMDYDRIGRNEPIGQLVLGTKCGPMELKHWNEMFAKSRTDVIKWHLLKDLS